ncbi:MAG TPA: hypothetical protein VN113_09235, partial [Caulobacter sp.]|nr:hypothetical protein [Caulobacter sp.]
AGAAAVATGAVAITAQQIGKTVGENLDHLHLTEEQLARVENKGVTMGDVLAAAWKPLADTLTGVWKSVADAVVGFIGPALKAVGDFFGDLYQSIIDGIMGVVKGSFQLIGGFVGGIRAAFAALPAAIGDVVISAVNIAAGGLEKLANGAIGIVNKLTRMANEVAAKLGIPIKLPELDTVSIGRLENKYAGAAANIGKALAKGTAQGVADGGKAYEQMVTGATKAVAEARNRRVIRQAGPATKAGQAVAGQDGDLVNNVTNNETSYVTNNTTNYEAANSAHSNSVSNVSARSSSATDAYMRGGGQMSEARIRELADTVRPLETVETLQAAKPNIPNKLDIGVPEIDEQNTLLSKTIDHFETLNKLATELGPNLEKAFGAPGKAVGGVIAAASTLGKKLAEISLAQKASTDEKETVKLARDRVNATVSGFAEMSIAAQGFFDKNSSGYAALQSVEKAYRTWQMAQQVQAMAREAMDTARAVANSMTKGAASTAAGAAKMFEVLGPFAFPAVAAMVALLAGFGLSGGGGGSVPGVNDMKTRQNAQGSGSVLGDSKAKSDSLEKALTHAQAYENKDLEYGNAMVRSLKSIDDQIGAVAAALARSFAAGGMLSTDGLNLGKSGSAPTLSNLGFSKSTTRTLQDQGVQFAAATLGDILAGGLSGSTYQQVLETTKKKAFGITTSNKSKVVTETGALDADFLDQVTRLIGSLGTGVSEAAKALKATGVEAALASFKVDLGKLSFKDMTGTQIQEALNAIFGKLGDDMAKAAVPAIAEFQKVGEGAFETLVRVARQYEVIDTTLTSVGMTFGAVGVASLAARERLVDLVGGLDNLTDQTAFFAEHFLSENERLKPVQDSVGAELKRLGQPADLSRQGFKDLVLKQDVSTEDGAKLYAALMALAPAFDKVATAAETARVAIADRKSSIQDQIDDLVMTPAQKLAKSRGAEEDAVKKLDASLLPLLKSLWGLQDASQAAADAAQAEADAKALATDRSNLLGDLLEAQGRTEEAKALRRANALAAIKDPVQQDYQQRIWAAEDAAAKVSAARDVLTQAYQHEHDAIQATKDKFAELSKSLRAFSASLSDTISGADLASRYRTTRQTFLTTASLARMGDSDAMGRLQSEGEAFTAASRDYVATSLDYLRDVGLVRAAVDEAADTADRQVSIAQKQLEALDASVQGLIQINASVISVQQAIAGLQGALAAARGAGVMSVGGSGLGLTPTAPPVPVTGGAENIFDGPVDLSKMNDATREFIGRIAWTDFKTFDPAIYHESEWSTAMRLDFQKRIDTGKVQAPMGFATGGGFEVGGSGPPDSKLFNLALSPGEAVNVRRADSKGDETLVNELRRLREELADLRATNARIATSNDKMERTLTNVTEGGRAMQTQAAA